MLFTTTQNAFMLTENILDSEGTIVASKRFPDEDPSTPDSFADEYYFYNYDIRGSVTSIIAPHDMTLPGGTTLQGGSPVAGYEYDEYGNLESNATQGFLNETTYTDSVTDKSTGLQYMSARYYDAENGRFLTQDTYTGNPYDPWTQHLYAYCGNNPVSMVDPTGHFMLWLMGIAKEKTKDSKMRKLITSAMSALATKQVSNYTYGYRYVDKTEYEAIKSTGKIPNTRANGNSKTVYTSPNKYNTVSEAEEALRIGKLHPDGEYPSPEYRVEFKYKDVKGIETVRPVKGGKGIEVLSKEEIPVDIENTRLLSNGLADNDDRDDDFDNSNTPDGTGSGGEPYILEGITYYEDRYGQRRPFAYSLYNNGWGGYFGGVKNGGNFIVAPVPEMAIPQIMPELVPVF